MKFSDVDGNNLLNSVTETNFSEYITVTSENGKVISNSFRIEMFGDQKYLQIQCHSMPDEFLKTINVSIKNVKITGTENVKTIVTNWIFERNQAAIAGVFLDAKEIVSSKDPQASKFIYYNIEKN
ncbi:hypothetical protein [Pedobacter africanus]|uniref:Uncharacterized protein n=1 Tax=Pedobacter africanus TaxID=151894 RepID=A0ACC6KVT7_9SPHI|nr:hypothetical protein [Pedobacter africanus]MDR6783290.1 hypothetical protein [Pedobacter africanus]